MNKHDLDDYLQERLLARLIAEMEKKDPDLAEKRASNKFIGTLLRRNKRLNENFLPKLLPSDLVETEFSDKNKELKFKKKALIYVGAILGYSHRDLATIFNLAQSRICAIIKEINDDIPSL